LVFFELSFFFCCDLLLKVPIDIVKGPTVAQTEQLAKDIGFKGAQAVDAATQMRKL
jgi:hypothetical protein